MLVSVHYNLRLDAKHVKYDVEEVELDLTQLYADDEQDGPVPPFRWIKVVGPVMDALNGGLDPELTNKIGKIRDEYPHAPHHSLASVLKCHMTLRLKNHLPNGALCRRSRSR